MSSESSESEESEGPVTAPGKNEKEIDTLTSDGDSDGE